MGRATPVIPGLPLTLGYTLFYLSLFVLVPLAGLILKTTQLTWHEFYRAITDPVVVAAFELTFSASALAAVINGICGLMVVWVLVREPFPGRKLFDALIDFPFALPTAVAGITFSTLYLKTGWIGGFGDHLAAAANWIAGRLGHPGLIGPGVLSWLDFPLSNTNAGIVVVLIFVGLPFVVRTVQPVLQEWDLEQEQAAQSLGASGWTIFRRVIFPEIFPAWLSGMALAFARAIGEYGSVIFIASNIPGKSQIVPLQIVIKLDEFQYAKATAIGVVLLFVSLFILLGINAIEFWARRREQT